MCFSNAKLLSMSKRFCELMLLMIESLMLTFRSISFEIILEPIKYFVNCRFLLFIVVWDTFVRSGIIRTV